MPHDPLSDLSVPTPANRIAETGVDPQIAAAMKDEADRIDLVAAARRFVTHDALVVSPYSRMSIGQKREFARAHRIPNQAKILDETDLTLTLIYMDQLRIEQHLRPLAVPEIAAFEPAPKSEPVAMPKLEPSPTNEWRVAKTQDVSLPGGVYRIHEGTIYTLAKDGPEILARLVSQNVKLEPYPKGYEKRSCDDCGTTWPTETPDKRQTPEACPFCYLMKGGEPTVAAEMEALRHKLAQTEARANELGIMHATLSRWAVEQGAQPPGADGTWQGEPHPPPIDFGKMRFNVAAEMPQHGASEASAAPGALDLGDIEEPTRPPPAQPPRGGEEPTQTGRRPRGGGRG